MFLNRFFNFERRGNYKNYLLNISILWYVYIILLQSKARKKMGHASS